MCHYIDQSVHITIYVFNNDSYDIITIFTSRYLGRNVVIFNFSVLFNAIYIKINICSISLRVEIQVDAVMQFFFFFTGEISL